MITLSDGTTTVELDPDLFWSDEFAWTPMTRTVTRGLDGSRIVQQGVAQYGRPITLGPIDESSAWMTRATLEQLQAWSYSGVRLTLAMRGVSRVVAFRYTEMPIEARPVVHYNDTDPGDYYLATLRFTEEAP